jgi:hypothetical protein
MSSAYDRAVARAEGRPVPPRGGAAPASVEEGAFDLYGASPSVVGGSNGGPVLADFAPPAIAAAPSAFDLIKQEIEDLFDEAKNFADGEPIATSEMAEAMTALYDSLHDAGKRADELRVAEKKPLDDRIKAIQDRFNPLIQSSKGKVALGKQALGELLTAWRLEQTRKAEAEAAAKREEAARLAAEAEAAIRASSGNLEAREAAEALLQDAKAADKWAGRAERKATTGTGLRTTWVTAIADQESAIDWAFGHAPEQFVALALSLAEAEVRVGKRKIAGFTIEERKVAT